MANKRVDDMLKHPETLTPKHNCDFGEALKWQGLLVAKALSVDFNHVVKQGLQLMVKDYKRKNKAEWDALNKQYSLFGKKKEKAV
jgi:hypothetical protein